MVFCIAALVLLAVTVSVLSWQLVIARKVLAKSKAQCESLRQDHAIRENLQQILDRREEQLRRLRGKLRHAEEKVEELEGKISELNLNLFHESGLRILAEKEDGARRMKQDLMEQQLLDAQRKLKTERAEAVAAQRQLEEIIDDQQRQIDRLTSHQGRRARRMVAVPDQVTIEDFIKEA